MAKILKKNSSIFLQRNIFFIFVVTECLNYHTKQDFQDPLYKGTSVVRRRLINHYFVKFLQELKKILRKSKFKVSSLLLHLFHIKICIC